MQIAQIRVEWLLRIGIVVGSQQCLTEKWIRTGQHVEEVLQLGELWFADLCEVWKYAVEGRGQKSVQEGKEHIFSGQLVGMPSSQYKGQILTVPVKHIICIVYKLSKKNNNR